MVKEFQTLIDGLIKNLSTKLPDEEIATENGLILINLASEKEFPLTSAIYKQTVWYWVETNTSNKITSIKVSNDMGLLGIEIVKNNANRNIENLIKLANALTISTTTIHLTGNLVGNTIIICKTQFGDVYNYVDANQKILFSAIERDNELKYNGSNVGKDAIIRYYEYVNGKVPVKYTAFDDQGNNIQF